MGIEDKKDSDEKDGEKDAPQGQRESSPHGHFTVTLFANWAP